MKEYYEEPKSLRKAVELIRNIHDYNQQSKTYIKFVNERKGDSKDAGHRLRLVHDEFLQDAYKHFCVGTIYRSEGMINLCKDGMKLKKGDKTNVHCEHVIPNNLLTKYIYHHLKEQTFSSLAEFIYKNRVICGIAIEERKMLKGWASSHPEICKKTGAVLENRELAQVKPFLRYVDTGIKVYNIFSETEEPIILESFTMQNHYDLCDAYQSEIKKLFEDEVKKVSPL